jgi:hypothetical protein
MRLLVRDEARSAVVAPLFQFCPGIATWAKSTAQDSPTSRTRASQKGRLFPHEAPFPFPAGSISDPPFPTRTMRVPGTMRSACRSRLHRTANISRPGRLSSTQVLGPCIETTASHRRIQLALRRFRSRAAIRRKGSTGLLTMLALARAEEVVE